MIITLIGMSGTGKSHWSSKLVHHGFKRICCDDLIEKKLEIELKAQGYTGIQDVARWMGQPYEPQYALNSRKYLLFECEVMKELLSFAEHADKKANVVIDSTGSVIYTTKQILKDLHKHTTLLYLQTPDHVKKEMFQRYITDPKPVIWGDHFNKKAEETETQALARCYPELLNYRAKQYATNADLVIDYPTHTSAAFSVVDLLKKVDDYQFSSTCFY